MKPVILALVQRGLPLEILTADGEHRHMRNGQSHSTSLKQVADDTTEAWKVVCQQIKSAAAERFPNGDNATWVGKQTGTKLQQREARSMLQSVHARLVAVGGGQTLSPPSLGAGPGNNVARPWENRKLHAGPARDSLGKLYTAFTPEVADQDQQAFEAAAPASRSSEPVVWPGKPHKLRDEHAKAAAPGPGSELKFIGLGADLHRELSGTFTVDAAAPMVNGWPHYSTAAESNADDAAHLYHHESRPEWLLCERNHWRTG